MKITTTTFAAALAACVLVLPASAMAQGMGSHDSMQNGPMHNGGTRNGDAHPNDMGASHGARHMKAKRHCRSVWRHHHRVRVCR